MVGLNEEQQAEVSSSTLQFNRQLRIEDQLIDKDCCRLVLLNMKQQMRSFADGTGNNDAKLAG